MHVLTSQGLLDIHERAHRNLKGYLSHARTLDPAAIDRKMLEFNGASVRLQLHHAVGAEKYWIGVLQGRVDADEDAHLYPTIESLEEYREVTFAATQEYLRNAPAEELNIPRSMISWHGEEQMLYPAHVVMRTITHIYHHQGQIAAMFRLLGSPSPGFDYPIK
jgi:uncharacterized damage-inducible protein DinB